jgi:hypothetical protein
MLVVENFIEGLPGFIFSTVFIVSLNDIDNIECCKTDYIFKVIQVQFYR